ncbi:sensor histidine kinase [Candidatus Symbiobacter mobilis]|uniref:histidine kinase n=1 Tax=Candidatus Symbiobacter mobilis CR TaxID=946483 RepID=U5N750_9BURK|nr:ATP-binding protein [Candidatus Symbiobacter mobilis]AGX87130.1 signal transduction histidine kinase [Candidatus Symbiobacter mobilis CR]
MTHVLHPAEGGANEPSRIARWALWVGVAFLGAVGLVLLSLLILATGNRNLYEPYYTPLFFVNAIVALALLGVIGGIAWRLGARRRSKKFGSRLLVRLAAVFALAGVIPGMLIYVVSYQFVARSIESWFDVEVEGALEAGLHLGRATLDAWSAEWTAKVRASAVQVSAQPTTSDATAPLWMEHIRDALGADDLTLWAGNGRPIAAAGPLRYQLSPEPPPPEPLRIAATHGLATWVDGLEEPATATASTPVARIRVLVTVNVRQPGTLPGVRYLLATKTLPPTFVHNALSVTQAHREYQERALAREGLRRMYIGALTLSLFLAVLGSVLLAIMMGNRIVRPLLLLADGVRDVAAGDFSPRSMLHGKDELDGLTRSFADMTRQLADARHAVQQSMEQVRAAHASLQTILDNLTAGVIVLDESGTIQTLNPGANRILRTPHPIQPGTSLDDLLSLQGLAVCVRQRFEALRSPREEGETDHWEQSFELAMGHALAPGHDTVTLLLRGAELPGNQQLIVFDDISHVISAQRTKAWAEVARRLAHEIRNPLTPIQLSAERLERKLWADLDEGQRAILTKSVRTIVAQVEAMLRLVNEFRDYARLPAAELRPTNLNVLVTELLGLYAQEPSGVSVVAELDPACPLIDGDAQQLRQVLHNLVQNALDATASAGRADGAHPVVVKTQWLGSVQRVRLSVLDHGTGFADALLQRMFEPYVTTKEKGTGLGLAVVKKIADEHRARVEACNRYRDAELVGAQVSLLFTTGQTGPAA